MERKNFFRICFGYLSKSSYFESRKSYISQSWVRIYGLYLDVDIRELGDNTLIWREYRWKKIWYFYKIIVIFVCPNYQSINWWNFIFKYII